MDLRQQVERLIQINSTGPVTSVSLSAPSPGFSVTGSPGSGIVNLGLIYSGNFPATSMPNFVGDATSTAGSTTLTVVAINGAPLGSTTPTAGNVLIGSGTQWVSQPLSTDATVSSAGVVTVTGWQGIGVSNIGISGSAGQMMIGSGSAFRARTPSGDVSVNGLGIFTVSTINGNTPAVAIYRQTALATVSNTTTETSILGTGVGSTTIAANTLKAGSVIRIKVSGIYSAAVTPGNLTVRVKLGTTAIVTATVANLLSSASNLGFEGECLLTFYTIGATAACQPGGNFEYTISAVGGRNFNDLNNGGATTSVNTTTSLAVDCTVTWATASTSNIIKNATGLIELIL